MRASLAVLALAFWSCSPPCEDTSWQPGGVCRRADAGQVVANQPFTLMATSYAIGTCRVVVDGGSITLSIEGTYCSNMPAGAAAPRDPAAVAMPCEIPALPEGTFVVTTSTPTSFTLPASADAGLPTCR